MIEEDYYCQCGNKMRRAGIFEDGKFKLTRYRICPSCGNIVNGTKSSDWNKSNKKENEPYIRLSKILAENRNFKNTLCLPEKQSSRIEKLERRILFDDIDTPESEDNVYWVDGFREMEQFKRHEIGKNELMPIHIDIEKRLAEFFGIDLVKVEEERSELLNQIRRENKK